jgi:phosphotransferase system enzyme I (PtsP)
MRIQAFKERGISIIEDVGRSITNSSGPAETLYEIAKLIADRFYVDVCSIYIFDGERNCLSLAATVGLSEGSVGNIYMSLNEGLTGLVIEELKPVFVKNPARHPRYKYFEGSGEEKYHSFLGLPLVYHGEALGVLVIQTVEETAINDSDIPIFSMIASQIAGEAAYVNLLKDLKKPLEKTDGRAERFSALQRGRALPVVKKDLLKGIPVSAGFGEGGAHYLRESIGFSDIYFHEADDMDHELSRFDHALKRSAAQIERLNTDVKSELSPEDKNIFHTYLMYFRDVGLKNKVTAYIEQQKYAAEYALKEVILDYVRVFSKMEDPYLRERGFDIENVGRRILKNLLGLEDDEPGRFIKKTIIIASSISPGELIMLRQENLKGIILSKGGETSHVAILAKSFEIPMVIISRVMLREIRENDVLIVDGTSGVIFHKPSEIIVREYQRLEDEKSQQGGRLETLRQLKPQTLDGFEVKLGANIGLLSDFELVEKYGADHIGLYRTEFPFLVRERFPSEDEQVDLYRRVLEAAKGKAVTIRTLDVGGDKFLSYLDYPREDNPYLGWRSIRVSLELRDVFREQIRAILKASAFGSLRILFPMISSVREIKDTLSILNEEKERLRERNVPFDDAIKAGLLLEVPAAAVILEKLLRYVDFVSVGTNDLVQFVLAVDRNNQKVAPIYNPLHPAVISTILNIVSVCKEKNKPVVICGEAAANPKCAYLYMGMDIDQLSMNAPSVPMIKHMIRNIEQDDAKEVLRRVLLMDDADEIEDFMDYVISPVLKEGIE